MDVALAAQRAESDFVGAPVGLMDQLAVLEGYLYAYRPHGQYSAIQESAARLRN